MATSTERSRALRARRRALLAPPDEGVPVRDAGELLGPAVADAVAALELAGSDPAAAALAASYARCIDQARDEAWALRWIGPLLLDTLTQLGCTPMSRAKLAKPGRQDPGPTRLDELRQSHASRHRL